MPAVSFAPDPGELRRRLESLGATDIDLFAARAIHLNVPASALVSDPEAWRKDVCLSADALDVTITGAADAPFETLLAALEESSVSGKTYSLEISEAGLDDASIELFAARSWPQLRWLSLEANNVDYSGALALARATVQAPRNLPELRYVNLDHNECNPVEQFEYTDDYITGRVLPKAGLKIEAQLGSRVPWLHRPVSDGREVIQNRYACATPQPAAEFRAAR